MTTARFGPTRPRDREAYAAGCAARRKGLPRDANPYRGQGERSGWWKLGWDDVDADVRAGRVEERA